MEENRMLGDHIVYVDESGDHGLKAVDPHYPVFVLAFCIFEKTAYANSVVPKLQELKFRHLGHDMCVLHERDIRKAKGDFKFLIDEERRKSFMADLNELMVSAPFTLIATCIRKLDLKRDYETPRNPYKLALKFGLERIHKHLRRKDQDDRTTHLVVESRGKLEDRDLAHEFQRVCKGANYRGRRLPFDLVFADKRTNSCGLQIADLVARPIGRHVLQPDQTNRAYEVLQGKFDRSPNGETMGWGLKIFP